MSKKGLKFIGNCEGFRGKLYNDVSGNCTIGYGHLVHMGQCNGSEPTEFQKGINQDQALDLLREDASFAADAVNGSGTVDLSQTQFDALDSFTFNVGSGTFRRSTLLRQLNAGQYAAVPSQMMRFVYSGGRVRQSLVQRRQAEGNLFSTGQYGPCYE